MSERIGEVAAKEIAAVDATMAYRDLSPYVVSARLEAGRWLIDYELADPRWQGGGPHYVIDAESGVILQKRYEQ